MIRFKIKFDFESQKGIQEVINTTKAVARYHSSDYSIDLCDEVEKTNGYAFALLFGGGTETRFTSGFCPSNLIHKEFMYLENRENWGHLQGSIYKPEFFNMTWDSKIAIQCDGKNLRYQWQTGSGNIVHIRAYNQKEALITIEHSDEDRRPSSKFVNTMMQRLAFSKEKGILKECKVESPSSVLSLYDESNLDFDLLNSFEVFSEVSSI